MRYLIILPLVIVFMLLSCGNQNHAGATTETTNGITLSLQHLNSPLAARIILYNTSLEPMDTLWSDSNGHAFWQNDYLPDSLQAEVRSNDSLLLHWIKNEPLYLLDTLQVNVDSAAQLQITSLLGTPRQLRLHGTPYIITAEGGVYNFGRIPAGTWALVDSAENILSRIQIAPAITLDTQLTLIPLLPRTILDDFSTGSHLHLLSQVSLSSGWYLQADNNAQWIQPATANEFGIARQVDSTALGASFISLQFNIPIGGYTLIGSHLGPDGISYDMRSLDAIRLRIRGNALLEVALEQIQENSPGLWRKALWRIQSSDNWQEWVLEPHHSLVEDIHAAVPFSEVGNEIAIFTIFLRQGDWLDIDYISLDGIETSLFSP